MKRLYFIIGIICVLLVFPLTLTAEEEAAEVPEQPINLRVTETNAETNSFSLAWDAVPGATEYRVYQIPQGRSVGWLRWISTTPDPITTPAAEVRRITLNTKYSYRVTALNDNGEGPPSEIVDVNLTK